MAILGSTGLVQLVTDIKNWVLGKIPTKTSDLTNDSHQSITIDTDTTSTASPAHSGTFTCVDSVTRDTNGHVTAINTKTVTLPSDNNTDTKMTQNVSTTNNKYPILLCPTAEATANQGAKTGIFGANALINPSTGEIISKSSGTGAFRVVGGNYGFFIRNDGSNTYFLLTTSGDQYGSWTSARPLTISDSTGVCSINGNAATATQFSANKDVTLTGYVNGTASSKAGWSIATALKNCYFHTGGTVTNTYFKVASGTLTGGWNRYETLIRFVETTGNASCTLRIYMQLDGSALFDAGHVTVLNSVNFGTSVFNVVYKNDTDKTLFEIYYQLTPNNHHVNALVLYETERKLVNSCDVLTMYNDSTPVAALPSDYTLLTTKFELYCGDLVPAGNNKNLGSSDAKWSNVYATTFTGNLTGNVTGNCSGSSGLCTGNAATASKVVATVANDNTDALVQGTMGTNDCFRIAIGGASNAGWAEIATGDDYNEPIYVRQYQGAFTTLKRTATLLDASGNTAFPGTVTATGFSGPLTGNVTGNCSGSSGSCTGNAATATQFSANTTVALTGDATGTSAGSKKGWSVPVTLANSGVTAGSYGPTADVTGNNNATISVPQITVDAKGRVTSVTNRTLTCKNNTYSVYNKTLTIQKNGTNVATFTSNSNTDVTANITVPTKTSELTNNSGFLTSHQSLSNYSTLANTVKSLSISGKTITVTPGSGNAYTLTTQDTVYTHPTTAGNKHIPSGGSSGQILKYSSSGTAVWADASFTRQMVFIDTDNNTSLPRTKTVTLTKSQLAVVTVDLTTLTDYLVKLTASNVFVVAIRTLVGTNAFKQDSVNYGSILQQGATGRTRVVALIYPYNTSVEFTLARVSGAGGFSSYTLTVYQ